MAKSAKKKAKSKAVAKSHQKEPTVMAAKHAAATPAKHKAPKAAATPKENEAQIAVHWKEEDLFFPSAKFIGQANLNDPAFVAQFDEANFPECFRAYADLLDW
ncbi:MAG TPA: hypothetical protein VHP80_05290, partial [Candidatus Acidoferrum sp.]|nr:hypothetical protein [Candidatus Acidoferrum sp.]